MITAQTLTSRAAAGTAVLNDRGTFTLDSTGSTPTYLGTQRLPSELTGGGYDHVIQPPYNGLVLRHGDTLINDTNNTIQGSGQIGSTTGLPCTLNNNGTINANRSHALPIAPSNTVTNTGTLEATAGGTLDLPGTFTNTGGIHPRRAPARA